MGANPPLVEHLFESSSARRTYPRYSPVLATKTGVPDYYDVGSFNSILAKYNFEPAIMLFFDSCFQFLSQKFLYNPFLSAANLRKLVRGKWLFLLDE
jgi:hypothetical protein